MGALACPHGAAGRGCCHYLLRRSRQGDDDGDPGMARRTNEAAAVTGSGGAGQVTAKTNSWLTAAKANKQDEFYTQLSDIEKELRHYRTHFKGKVVLCNCDDPYESDFFKYFVINFRRLGLKKLIASCYSGSPIAGHQLSFSDLKGLTDEDVVAKRPYVIEITDIPDADGDGSIGLADVEFLLRHDANLLTALDGDGDFRSLVEAMQRRGVRVVGVPKTIDNDLEGTDQTFGFNTALELATDAIDRLHTTAESHDRVLVLEVMGRTAGWIALHAAIAGGADVVLIPELPFSYDRVAAAAEQRERAGKRFSIVVVAEGAAPAGGQVVEQEAGRLGAVGAVVAAEIARRTGKETRVAVLGHLQRGGRPTAVDRLLATAFGAAAVRTLASGARGRVVALHGTEIVTVPLAEVAGRCRRVPLDSPLLQTAVDLGMEIGAAFGEESAEG